MMELKFGKTEKFKSFFRLSAVRYYTEKTKFLKLKALKRNYFCNQDNQTKGIF